MRFSAHLTRVPLLMVAAGGWLAWKADHAAIIFADSLRYIHQAREIDGGDAVHALFHAIDHPAYPLAIAATHRMLGGTSPEAWQVAGQTASVVAGVALVVPLYLIAGEMFGAAVAWLAVVLSFLVPTTSQVMADALSESWFLLFFSCGVWTAIRFLRQGKFAWLPLTVACAALAYWVRPEGVLLPAAMVATLAVIPFLRSTRLVWPRWWAAVGFLVIGPALLAAPIIATKGGISTKPAVQRVLGIGSRSAPLAVERQRPLKAGQTTTETTILATRAMAFAVRDAVTIPLLPLALLGFVLAWPPGDKSRMWVFLTVVMVAWTLALIRLFATGGYCTPRHTLILAYPLIAAAAAGLIHGLRLVSIPGRWVGQPGERFTIGPIGVLGTLVALTFVFKADLQAPLNSQFAGYRGAAEYLDRNVPKGDKVVDLTGWSLFYGERSGYTFANLIEAMGDRELTRVVVRDAHLNGPWEYCAQIHQLIGDRKPVATFPEHPAPKQSQVFVYDWSPEQVARAAAASVVK